jgi:hypothetical protein
MGPRVGAGCFWLGLSLVLKTIIVKIYTCLVVLCVFRLSYSLFLVDLHHDNVLTVCFSFHLRYLAPSITKPLGVVSAGACLKR